MSKLETNTIDTVSGTSTLQVGSTNTTTITLGVSGDTINVPSGVTIANSGTATGFGGANTPAVSAYSNANQTVTDNVSTKVAFNAELYDTDSAFDTSTYRFTVPSGKAGKYFIYSSVYMYGNNNDERLRILDIYLNGGQVRRFETFGYPGTGFSNGGNFSGGAVLDLSVGDYIEIFGKLDVNSGTPAFYGASAATSRYTILEIFRLVE